MSADEEKQSALVPVRSTALTKVGAKSLAARGRYHLRDKEEAEEWLRKGLELQDAAPADPRWTGPIDPYAAPPPVLTEELRRIKREVEQEQLKRREEKLGEAFRCFESGHELDPINPELLYWFAECYYEGHGVLKNEEKAVALYQRAADMGHARAQKSIGDAHARCGFTCLPKDEKEAARWYQAAAEQGDEEAICMIVDMYLHGEGVIQDYAEAARILQNAIERGDETARHNWRLFARQFGSAFETALQIGRNYTSGRQARRCAGLLTGWCRPGRPAGWPRQWR